jgi:hypothetical protein
VLFCGSPQHRKAVQIEVAEISLRLNKTQGVLLLLVSKTLKRFGDKT